MNRAIFKTSCDFEMSALLMVFVFMIGIIFIFTIGQSQATLPANEIPMYNDPDRPSYIEEKIKKGNGSLENINYLKSVSKHATQRGWDYVSDANFSAAIKRFNQAWQIDKENFEAYWGFAIITKARDKDYRKANKFFNMAINLYDKNPQLFIDKGYNCVRFYDYECARNSFTNAYDLFTGKKNCDGNCYDTQTRELFVGLYCISKVAHETEIMEMIQRGIERNNFYSSFYDGIEDKCRLFFE